MTRNYSAEAIAAIAAKDIQRFAAVVKLVPEQSIGSVASELASGGDISLLDNWLVAGWSIEVRSRGVTMLSRASGGGNEPMVRRLLELGASLAGVPLVAAAYAGSLECVKLLVEAGADVNIGHKGFPTPLSTAIAFKHHDIEAYLRAHGATKLVGEGAPE